jgi:hypothetical protein
VIGEMTPEELIEDLHRCFGADTARGEWREDVPAMNQCAVAALVVQDMFGGILLRAPMSNGDGYYHNRLPDGTIIDPTASQLSYVNVAIDFDNVEQRSRQYVLSYPDTIKRYSILLGRLADLLVIGRVK